MVRLEVLIRSMNTHHLQTSKFLVIMLGIVVKDLQNLSLRSGPVRGWWRDGSDVKEHWLFFQMTGGSIPSTHMTHNCLLTPVPGEPMPFYGLLRYQARIRCTDYIRRQNTHAYKNKSKWIFKEKQKCLIAEGHGDKGEDGGLPWSTGRMPKPCWQPG